MFEKSLSGATLALLFAAAPLIAQEVAPADPGTASVYLTPADTGDLSATDVDAGLPNNLDEADAGPATSSFFLPGGYGYLPEVITPGSGLYGRPPVEFFLNLEMGYDDNIYSSSGQPFASPKKGSPTTQATLGVNALLSNNRTFLSVGADAGAVYYWDRDGNEFSPVGTLRLVWAHSATERLSFSSRVSAGYYNQPDYWQANLPLSNTGDYFDFSGYFDISYRWSQLFSTITTFGVGTQAYRYSYSDHHNYFRYSVGQQFRYLFTPRFTGVLDLRFDHYLYYNDTNRDSTTESVLVGFDWLMSPRLTSTLRAGVSFRQYELAGAPNNTSPYAEAGLGYRYGQGSMLQWSTRYGYEEGNWSYQRTHALRNGLSVVQVITPRLSASAGIYYVYEFRDQMLPNQPAVSDQQLIDLYARLNYAINRSFTVYGGYGRTQVINDNAFNEYNRNRYTLGVSYRF